MQVDYAWAAGVLESEGHLGAAVSDTGSLSLHVEICQNDVDMLFQLTRIFGYGSIRPHPHGGARWRACGANAEDMVRKVMTYMSSGGKKFREAQLWLKLRATTLPRGERLTKKIRSERFALAKKLKTLRHGVDNRVRML